MIFLSFLLYFLQSQPCIEVTVDTSFEGKAVYRVYADGSFTLDLTKNFGEGFEYSAAARVSEDSISSLIHDLSDMGYFSLNDSLIEAQIRQEAQKTSVRLMVYDASIYTMRILFGGAYHSFHSEGASSYMRQYPNIRDLSTANNAINRMWRFLFILDALAKSPQVQRRLDQHKQ